MRVMKTLTSSTTSSVTTSKPDKIADAEGRADSYIGSVPAVGNRNSTDARHIVPGIECIPATAKISLEPTGEIHRIRHRWHADIAQIACAIPCRDIHAAAERDR